MLIINRINTINEQNIKLFDDFEDDTNFVSISVIVDDILLVLVHIPLLLHLENGATAGTTRASIQPEVETEELLATFLVDNNATKRSHLKISESGRNRFFIPITTQHFNQFGDFSRANRFTFRVKLKLKQN